jgi:malate dehydrogenase
MSKEAKVEGKKQPVRFLITGAAGQIGYSLIPLVASGQVLGPDQPVILHLLDIPPCQKALDGVVMEVEDCAFPLLHSLVATTNVEAAFKGVQYAILVGGFPRKDNMTRRDLLDRNSPIFITQGKALSDYSDPNVKVLVVANPANTNCLVALKHATKIPKENFSCLTRLDQNRSTGQIAKKLGVSPGSVRNTTIWGNHSSTMFPDLSLASFDDGKQDSKVTSKLEPSYVTKEFTSLIQERGAAVIAARGASSAMSAAFAACQHMKDWILGTAPGQVVSMGVYSDGSYGIAKDIVFSFPCTCKNGAFTIVQDVPVDEYARAMLKKTEAELLNERSSIVPAESPKNT